MSETIHEQTVLQTLGAEACYLLVVKKIAELVCKDVFNPVWVYLHSVEKGWARSDCLLYDSAAILGWLTGMEWQKGYWPPQYDVKQDVTVYIAGEYWRKTPKAEETHFVLLDNKPWEQRGILYNPLVSSITVDMGKLRSLRVFTLKGGN